MASTIFGNAASLAGSFMLIRSLISGILPSEYIAHIRRHLSSRVTLVIPETEGLSNNRIYYSVKTYLATKIPPSTRWIRATKCKEGDPMDITIEPGEEVVDLFCGIQFKWRSTSREKPATLWRSNGYHSTAIPTTTDVRSFELSFHKKHKDTAMGEYLNYVIKQAKVIEENRKTLKLYTNEYESWRGISLANPSTFDTLAMDFDAKKAVMDDLMRFVERKDYYRKIGKAWKRGYLLYGPPGTGKTSLIGAMANFLKFDIYDLDLKQVEDNMTLRMLLIGVTNRSILVIEDIDCSAKLQNREDDNDDKSKSKDQNKNEDKKITLSALLNVIDGLLSNYGEERIIIFTTNYKDRIDPALLRPGRMDMHILMGYCGSLAFRVLASNYHSIKEHHLFGEVEELLREVEVTPAEVAEELIRSDDADVALRGLIEFIKGKRRKDGDDGAEERNLKENSLKVESTTEDGAEERNLKENSLKVESTTEDGADEEKSIESINEDNTDEEES